MVTTDPPQRSDYVPRNGTSVGPEVNLETYCAAHALLVTQVAAHSWLVKLEPRAQCPGGVLGRVEQRNRDFIVIKIGEHIPWTAFATLGEAVAHLIFNEPVATPSSEPMTVAVPAGLATEMFSSRNADASQGSGFCDRECASHTVQGIEVKITTESTIESRGVRFGPVSVG